MPEEIIVQKLSDAELDEQRDKKLVESQSWEKVLETLENETHDVEVLLAAEEKKSLDIDHKIAILRDEQKDIAFAIKDLRLKKRKLEHEASKGRSCRRIVDKDYARLTNEMFRRQKGH